tara:strand:+ start:9909 stop:10442 length:534 start_codon:yes stop_codon:yes gene_type:complete
MSNLRLLNETTVSSGVATVNITDVFSSDFDIYKIVSTAHIHNADKDIYMRYINSSGSIISAGNYDTASLVMRTHSTNSDNLPSSRNNIDYGGYFNLTMGNNGGGAVEYVFNPTNTSSYTFGINQSLGMYGSTGGYGTKTIRVLKQTASITGIHLYNGESSDNFGGGTVKIYGLRVDS